MSDMLKHPVILPKHSHISTLIARYIHNQTHQGKVRRGATLNGIRESGYWIMALCHALYINASHAEDFAVDCSTKRWHHCLKTDRKKRLHLLTAVSDYFGPFYIRVKRSDVPRYGALFTYMTSRAIHLEVAESLDTDTFINALCRFIAIRGPIRHLCSDRGTNFCWSKECVRKGVSCYQSNESEGFSAPPEL